MIAHEHLYGPEAALTILIPLGAAGLYYVGPVILVILALLAILYVSYRQTISAYPTGGGSYTVAKENLGTNAGLLAASALLLDYVLNVAVAISAGVGATTSARAARFAPTPPLVLDLPGPPVIVVPTDGWNKLTEKSLGLAVRLSPDVTAIHLSELNGDGERADELLCRQWGKEVEEPVRLAGLTPPRLEIIHSPYRKFLDPLLAYVEKLKVEFPTRQIAVIIPEVVKRRWWQYLLHQYRAERLRSALLRSGDKRTILINVPWYLD